MRALAASGSTFWAGLDDGDLMKGTEPANTWTVVMTDPGHTVWSIAADPKAAATAFVVEWDNHAGGDLLGTTNGGASWTPATLPGNPAVQVAAFDVNTSGVIYAGADPTQTYAGMFVSKDSGKTWAAAASTGDVRMLWSWPNRSRVIVAGTDQGLYLSKTRPRAGPR